ncbi:hypothetical protein [Herbaspirillum sp. YR522]|uniref:hypothetical protein n=1 Tax=Herbaspirillum sp. YR522 TaxID=1144342 RepID=UPI0012F9C2CF|nr:hypothetical protein [Herbaspirillum sp. YR522]
MKKVGSQKISKNSVLYKYTVLGSSIPALPCLVLDRLMDIAGISRPAGDSKDPVVAKFFHCPAQDMRV